MSEIVINGSAIGSALTEVLMADDIVPGTDVGYATAKTIYTSHPLGKKMVDTPIKMAQSQKRKITVARSPGQRVVDKFEEQWRADHCNTYAATVASLARMYGLSSMTIVVDGEDSEEPLDFASLANAKIGFNCLDPLNTAGSLVLNQDPNSIDFQKTASVSVQGVKYHFSRSVILMHERPIYIDYTTSAFGFVGRSVFQRALFPLKTFVQTMVTDDMVAKKAGLLIAKMKAPGSIIDAAMAKMSAVKRNLLKEAKTGNVITVGHEDVIETLDMKNLEAPANMARDHSIDNVAAAADMPALMLKSDTLTQGFGEGTEDAKMVASYVDGIREWMGPVYDFLDLTTMHRAWNEDFYATIQKLFPGEYGSVDYKTAFYDWKNSFKAEWPSLITEPDSEKIKVEEARAKAALGVVEVVLPQCDPENKAVLLTWLTDVMAEQEMLFKTKLQLDPEALAAYTPPAPALAAPAEGKEPTPPKPEAD